MMLYVQDAIRLAHVTLYGAMQKSSAEKTTTQQTPLSFFWKPTHASVRREGRPVGVEMPTCTSIKFVRTSRQTVPTTSSITMTTRSGITSTQTYIESTHKCFCHKHNESVLPSTPRVFTNADCVVKRATNERDSAIALSQHFKCLVFLFAIPAKHM